MKKTFGIFFILVFSLALGVGLRGMSEKQVISEGKTELANIIETSKPIQKEEKKESAPITLLFAGDLMLERGVEYYTEKIGGGNRNFPFLLAEEYLNSFDTVIVNLEGPISDKGVKLGSIYSFKMNPEVIPAIMRANIGVVNFANNHVWDYGRDAFEDTLTRLENAKIGYFGAGWNESSAYGAYMWQKDDVRVAFLGFSEFLPHVEAGKQTSGIAYAGPKKIKTAIETAKKNSDVVIVSFHFGEEYFSEPIERQEYLAHIAVDAGADLVIGHHPHVIETEEMYNGVKIFYSLGNLIFDQNFSEETMTPGLLEVEIKEKKITSTTLKKAKLNKFYQLIPPKETLQK